MNLRPRRHHPRHADGGVWYDLDDDPRFPPKSTVYYYYFVKWSQTYIFDKLNHMIVRKLRYSRRVKQRYTKPRRRQ